MSIVSILHDPRVREQPPASACPRKYCHMKGNSEPRLQPNRREGGSVYLVADVSCACLDVPTFQNHKSSVVSIRKPWEYNVKLFDTVF